MVTYDTDHDNDRTGNKTVTLEDYNQWVTGSWTFNARFIAKVTSTRRKGVEIQSITSQSLIYWSHTDSSLIIIGREVFGRN